MKHPRQNIREAVTARLKETFPSVFCSRATPLFDQDLPAVLVYCSSEQIRHERWDTDGTGALTREMTLLVEAVAGGGDDLDNRLDDMAQQIESSLDGWVIPQYPNATLRFVGTDMDMRIDGNKTYGAVRLEYSITYFTDTKNEQH